MSRYIMFCLVALGLAGLTGWISVSGGAQDDRLLRDPWPESLTSASAFNVDDIRSRLNKSLLFPKSKSAQSGPNGTSADGPNAQSADEAKAPPFPSVRGVIIMDGHPHVTLELKNGDVHTLPEGATLESGWRLKSVDLTRLVAVYKDEERTVPIRDYAPGG